MDELNNNNIDPSNEEQNPQNLLKALQSERFARETAEQELKLRKEKEAEYEAKIKELQDIDPKKYKEMLVRQTAMEEEELKKAKQWEALQSKYQEKENALQSELKGWQEKYRSAVITQEIKEAFLNAGGISDVQAVNGEMISPLDLIASFFAGRIQLDESGRAVLYDRSGRIETIEGRNKTLAEKMLEMKRGTMASLFRPENRHTGTGSIPTIGVDGKQLVVYTKEQARLGQADMAKIARGEAVIR